MTGNRDFSPILKAAKIGDAVELKRLLHEKSDLFFEEPTDEPLYPEHWKYHYDDLLETDKEGRTALHLAAAVGNQTMSLACVTALLDSMQMLMDDDDDDPPKTSVEKHRELINMKNNDKETALHLAIRNGTTKVVTFLLKNQADFSAKNKDGKEALALIYLHLPEAMWDVYDSAVKLQDDHQSFNIDWGPVIGYRHGVRSPKKQNHGPDGYTKVPPLWVESESLKYVLVSESWGCPLLRHPLVKLFLELKWRKIQWLFWISFLLQISWLLLYAVGFVALHIEMKSNSSENHTPITDLPDSKWRGYHILWILLAPLTAACALKEAYQFKLLGRAAYANFENITQALFVFLFFVQFVILMAGYSEHAASLSVVGIILSTMLLIFQLGKTPYFGLQVASLRKVIYSFLPHIPVFLAWFVGFGLIFWATFYKAEESWLVGMVAIMAAMGTGELNAQDHLEPDVEDGQSISFRECVRVFSLLFFVIVIVTLYFNLLIGYAVSDIKDLKEKAEALELTNRLNTIYTIESFLISKPGQAINLLKCKLGFCGNSYDSAGKEGSLDAIYVMSPNKFVEKGGVDYIPFGRIPKKLLNPLKDIAFETMMNEREKEKLMSEKIDELQRVNI